MHVLESTHAPDGFVFFQTAVNGGFNILCRKLGVDRVKLENSAQTSAYPQFQGLLPFHLERLIVCLNINHASAFVVDEN